MFSYFTSIVRVSEVKRKRLFSGCTPEADKSELTEREPHALITHLFFPIASRHRHYDSLQRHLISKTKSPTRKEGDFIRSVHPLDGNRAIQRGLIIILTKGQQATPGPTVLSPPPYRCYGQVLAEARSHPYQ